MEDLIKAAQAGKPAEFKEIAYGILNSKLKDVIDIQRKDVVANVFDRNSDD